VFGIKKLDIKDLEVALLYSLAYLTLITKLLASTGFVHGVLVVILLLVVLYLIAYLMYKDSRKAAALALLSFSTHIFIGVVLSLILYPQIDILNPELTITKVIIFLNGFVSTLISILMIKTGKIPKIDLSLGAIAGGVASSLVGRR
jgi:hypothetical protein